MTSVKIMLKRCSTSKEIVMYMLRNIRLRLNRIAAAAIAALFFGLCGALMVFVLFPQQALEARHIARLPDMSAEDVDTADPGDEVLVTGRLEDNPALIQGGFVAYKRERWQVTQPTPGSSQSATQSAKPNGQWQSIEHIVPDLTLEVNGRQVNLLRAERVTLSGPLHERLIRAYSFLKAEYNGQELAEGSERVRGFYNGDLVTALGSKASTGGVIPTELYAGDRVAFAQYKKSAASSLLIFGLCLMGLSPAILGGGILSSFLSRRR